MTTTAHYEVLASRMSRLSAEECATLIDLVGTRMAAEHSDPRWALIRDTARTLGTPLPTTDLSRVLTVVTLVTGEPSQEILCQSRRSGAVFARHLAMATYRELSRASLSVTGRAFGNRDHGTVLHAERQVRNRHETSRGDRALIDAVRSYLGLASWSTTAATP